MIIMIFCFIIKAYNAASEYMNESVYTVKLIFFPQNRFHTDAPFKHADVLLRYGLYFSITLA